MASFLYPALQALGLATANQQPQPQQPTWQRALGLASEVSPELGALGRLGQAAGQIGQAELGRQQQFAAQFAQNPQQAIQVTPEEIGRSTALAIGAMGGIEGKGDFLHSAEEAAKQGFVYHGTTTENALNAIRSEGMTKGMFSRTPYPGASPHIAVRRADLPEIYVEMSDSGVIVPDWAGKRTVLSKPAAPIPPEKIYLADSQGNIMGPLVKPTKLSEPYGGPLARREVSPLHPEETLPPTRRGQYSVPEYVRRKAWLYKLKK